MKKHLIIAGIICAVTIPPAAAVTKCVALNSSTTCTYSSGAAGQSNWSARCGGIVIHGVAFCGSQDGVEMGRKNVSVTISSTSADNKYCWCRMFSPAFSLWVFSGSYPSAGKCADRCAANCAEAVQYDPDFRPALFSGLSD